MPNIIGALPYTFSNGTTADATQVNANFSTIASDVNSGAAATGINADITELAGTGAGVPVAGTKTNNNAASGFVGEYVSSDRPIGSAISVSNNVAANVGSISLSAGDWDVSGSVIGTVPGSGGAYGSVSCWVNSTSASQGSAFENIGLSGAVNYIAGQGANLVTGTVRFSLAVTTTIYLSVIAQFTGTVTVYGSIRARRVR